MRIVLFILLSAGICFSQYKDQFYSYEKADLIDRVETLSGTKVSSDGKSIVLEDGALNGYVIFRPDSSEEPFNRGLPSWNGSVQNSGSGFKVQIRFYNNGWSPWLTVGYWKENVWPGYGNTSYSGGKIDYDYAVLNQYVTKWQYQVLLKRSSSALSSPGIRKLSLQVSDQRVTDNVNITNIVNDKPAQLFIPTQHFYQYGLDPGIGGNICSPTSVSMVLRSYDIPVEPVQFARDNYDPYYRIFGIWPRAVQNAAEKGLNGAVTRYRTWSEAREVLAAGGRIVMSVGLPLYEGHLIMLAGFDASGNPIVHDPAKSNGYSYKFNKTSLSRSWFEKGGIAYTFFLDSAAVTYAEAEEDVKVNDYQVFTNYPNPFNPLTNIKFEVGKAEHVKIAAYDIQGSLVETIFEGTAEAGVNVRQWNASHLPSGSYFIRVRSGSFVKTIKAVLLK